MLKAAGIGKLNLASERRRAFVDGREVDDAVLHLRHPELSVGVLVFLRRIDDAVEHQAERHFLGVVVRTGAFAEFARRDVAVAFILAFAEIRVMATAFEERASEDIHVLAHIAVVHQIGAFLIPDDFPLYLISNVSQISGKRAAGVAGLIAGVESRVQRGLGLHLNRLENAHTLYPIGYGWFPIIRAAYAYQSAVCGHQVRQSFAAASGDGFREDCFRSRHKQGEGVVYAVELPLGVVVKQASSHPF